MTYQYITTQELLKKDCLTYQEILNIKKRLTGYSKTRENKDLNDYEWKDEYKLKPFHELKGYNWLIKVTFKPSCLDELYTKWAETEGNCEIDWAMRKNSPLGYREATILLNYDHFTFTGFYDASNYVQVSMGIKNLMPEWRCYANDGDSFTYHLEAGEAVITG